MKRPRYGKQEEEKGQLYVAFALKLFYAPSLDLGRYHCATIRGLSARCLFGISISFIIAGGGPAQSKIAPVWSFNDDGDSTFDGGKSKLELFSINKELVLVTKHSPLQLTPAEKTAFVKVYRSFEDPNVVQHKQLA
ncbi:hypothetical protein COOONC_25694 [Cooperia oncophora]